MREEIDGLVAEMAPAAEVYNAGMRTYHQGRLWGRPTALVFSGWGKVAAATTATYLITRFDIGQLIFTGVAGAADPGLRVGDVVVGSRLCQHDMDCRPLFARHEIPLLGLTAFETDPRLRRSLLAAAHQFLTQGLPTRLAPELRAEFHIARPRVVEGEIASGDRFIAGRTQLDQLRKDLPSLSCVEMEGAAVAQVCHEYGVPFAIVRTISDSADEHAAAAFPTFIRHVASVYSHGILRNLLCNQAEN
jgi:adenosylhomocysteine nucleosidase